MFSKACEYGIRASIFVASQSMKGNRVGLRDIAKEINSPEAFTAKIMQILSRNAIIHSAKGVGGGFEIPKELLNSIKLSQVVNAIDGDSIYKGCGLGLHLCSEVHPCPVHHKFKAIREELRLMLEDTSLLELATGVKSGETFLKL